MPNQEWVSHITKIMKAKEQMMADLEILYEGYQESFLEIEGPEWRPCVIDFLSVATGILEMNLPGSKPAEMSMEQWRQECVETFDNAHDIMDGLRGEPLKDHYTGK